MKKPKYIYKRYFLFQIPSLTIVSIISYFVYLYFELPVWIAALMVVLWIVKDIIMFPFVWKSYSLESEHNSKLVGKTGITLTDLDPKGSVRVNGEIWRAINMEKQKIAKGKQILVKAINGMELQVKSYNNSGK